MRSLKYTPEALSSPWIPITERLPEPGRYVLVRLTKNNWGDIDQEGVYFKVCKLVRGISEVDREKMKRGEIPDPEERSWVGERYTALVNKRSNTYKSGDEHGNNHRPYSWESFGPGGYFGQEVDYWMEIPRT